jgi:hypothetical protein
VVSRRHRDGRVFTGVAAQHSLPGGVHESVWAYFAPDRSYHSTAGGHSNLGNAHMKVKTSRCALGACLQVRDDASMCTRNMPWCT